MVQFQSSKTHEHSIKRWPFLPNIQTHLKFYFYFEIKKLKFGLAFDINSIYLFMCIYKMKCTRQTDWFLSFFLSYKVLKFSVSVFFLHWKTHKWLILHVYWLSDYVWIFVISCWFVFGCTQFDRIGTFCACIFFCIFFFVAGKKWWVHSKSWLSFWITHKILTEI